MNEGGPTSIKKAGRSLPRTSRSKPNRPAERPKKVAKKPILGASDREAVGANCRADVPLRALCLIWLLNSPHQHIDQRHPRDADEGHEPSAAHQLRDIHQRHASAGHNFLPVPDINARPTPINSRCSEANSNFSLRKFDRSSTNGQTSTRLTHADHSLSAPARNEPSVRPGTMGPPRIEHRWPSSFAVRRKSEASNCSGRLRAGPIRLVPRSPCFLSDNAETLKRSKAF